MSLPAALVACPPNYYTAQPLEIRSALSMIGEPSDVLRRLLDGNHSTVAGIIGAADLAGYRNRAVYIRQSMHTPPSPEAVRDLIPAFFELLREEESPEVRVVLGHFFFVYIHPFMDGNGRTGRFLMNLLMAAGGYPWLVIPVERRNEYMDALESAGVDQDIVPFTQFLAGLLGKQV